MKEDWTSILCNNQKFYDSATYCVFQSFQHNTTLVHLNLSNTRLVATEDTAHAFNKFATCQQDTWTSRSIW